MQNIIWERPDGQLEITEIYIPPAMKIIDKGETYTVEAEVITSRAEAARLQSLKLHVDQKAVAFDFAIPADKALMAAWRWDKKAGAITIDLEAAREVAKERLRAQRRQAFIDLGFGMQLHPEVEKKIVPADVQKELKRLRDIPKKADGVKDVILLRNMTIED